MDENWSNYIQSLLPAKEQWVAELEKTAIEERIPIMDTESLHFLLQLIRMKEPKNILEIGTAIGYSALRMAAASPGSHIVTIEKDENRYVQAKENVERLQKNEQIEIIPGDALEIMESLAKEERLFDVIFIDAAKGKYRQFFQLATPILAPKGIIISDNVLFRGFVLEGAAVPARYKNLVNKLKQYNKWVMSHPSFHTSILPIGDGVAVSQHIEREEGIET
ncbi:caffeoyl-CoA O-methyltransferase [Compostibacillus humi]|uniref:tRNA 5-hydroxyuridine methyltransferase n=1 Tax=Compostibacillus humi TaxID=1245525 RepID=A0A8J2ZPN2_9BACI|nr:O-methyltransferase [Compostibacillus humi]GGH68406.1 caffeoyl-CoA O-methyltransferase [Compostibacillus humi]